MKQTASSVWNGIKATMVNIASSLREAAVSAFQRMVSGSGSALSGLYSVVSNGFSSAIRFITGLPGQAFQRGKDFIQGLINGISSMIQSVINTVSGLADRIRSFLHFSAPDEGPLADYETWMPDFMKGLASGIEKNRNPDSYEVQMDDVEADSGGETEAGTMQRDVVRAGVVSIPVTFSVSAKWLKILTEYKQQEKIAVGYFDTETLAAKMAEMYVEGYKASLVKDTSRKGLWTVSFTPREF